MQMNIKSLRNVSNSDLHSAFTDLVQWQGLYFCTFREGEGHCSHKGGVVIMVSDDLAEWKRVAFLQGMYADVRDPKFLATSDKLFVYCPTWDHPSEDDVKYEKARRLTVMSESMDGYSWSEPAPVYEPGWAFWRPVEFEGKYYVAAYQMGEGENAGYDDPAWAEQWRVSLLSSDDGRQWEFVSDISTGQCANETALYAAPDGRLVALVRREGRDENGDVLPNLLCMALAPYAEWHTLELELGIQGPAILEFGDHLIIGGRTWSSSDLIPRINKTTLLELTSDAHPVKTIASLPSWGDCSYPGFVQLSDTELAVSYYSSHEGVTQAFLARVELTWDSE